MEIKTEKTNGAVILRVHGEIDLYNAPILKEEMEINREAGETKFVINLDQVTYIDSSGIGAFISARKNLQKAGGELVLSCVHGTVRDVLVLTKLISFFQIFETDTEAVAAIA